MTDYGSDISTWLSTTPDLDPTFSVISGGRVVAEAVARRWVTPAGGGLFYDTSYGFATQLLLNMRSDRSLPGIAMQLEQEALKDERVQACSVSISRERTTLKIKAVITPFSDKTFPLVLSYDQLTAQFSAIFPSSV